MPNFKEVQNKIPRVIIGLSSDIKPLDKDPLTQFLETDTGILSEYSGSSWRVISVNGAAKVVTDSGSINAYGNYPQTQTPNYTGVSSSSVTTDIYLGTDLRMYGFHSIEAITAAAKVEVSLDGVNFVQVAVEIQDDVVAGQPKSLTIAVGKIGVYRGKCYALRVRPNTATATNARILHGNL